VIDAAHIVDTSWDRTRPLAREQLMQALAGFTLTFDRNLDEARARLQVANLIWVRYHGFERIGPAVTIPGAAVARGTIVRWRPIFPANELIQRGLQLQQNGQVVIDLVADYLFDTTGLPASSSAGALLGGRGPFLPGGILRLFIQQAG
jgi:hypothetical protein